MSDPISDYQRWKQQGEDLRSKAKQAIESRYRELLTEAIQLAEEYRQDFGKALANPTAVTAFRYKAVAKLGSKKKLLPSVKKVAVAEKAPVRPAKPNPAVAGIEKKLANTRKKLEAARAAAKPTKDLEDKVYELEDDLRLAQG